MQGILLVDKPAGITSHKVVEIIRRKLNIKKVGHAGTLDPIATGLLIIMVGSATKLSNKLISETKGYEVEMVLFLETETGDISGKEKRFCEVINISRNQVTNSLNKFNGIRYFQKPPIYSAIKKNGMKLYEYARKGLEVEISEREVFIKKVDFLDYNIKSNKVKFFVDCSKGTYIRSLVTDIAKDLNTIASVSNLRRVNIGEYLIKNSKKLEDIDERDIISINI